MSITNSFFSSLPTWSILLLVIAGSYSSTWRTTVGTATTGMETSWALRLGFGGFNAISAVRQTKDGGYIVCGYISNLSEKSTEVSKTLGFLAKLRQDGSIALYRVYSNLGNDQLLDIQPTADGGYLAVGSSAEASNTFNNEVAWVMKVDPEGNIEWEKPSKVNVMNVRDM